MDFLLLVGKGEEYLLEMPILFRVLVGVEAMRNRIFYYFDSDCSFYADLNIDCRT